MSPARVEIDEIDYTALLPKFPLEEEGVSTVEVFSTLPRGHGSIVRRTLSIVMPTYVTYVTRDVGSNTETPFLGGLSFCLPEEVAIRSVLTALRSLGVRDLTEDRAIGIADTLFPAHLQSPSEGSVSFSGLHRVHPAASNFLSTLLQVQIEALRLNGEGQLAVSGEDETAITLFGMLGGEKDREHPAETFTLPGGFDKVIVRSRKYGHFTLRLVPVPGESSDRDGVSGYKIDFIDRVSGANQIGMGKLSFEAEDEDTLKVTILSPLRRDAEDPHDRGWSQEQIDAVGEAFQPILQAAWQSEGSSHNDHESLPSGSPPNSLDDSWFPLSKETQDKLTEAEWKTLRRIGSCSCVKSSNDPRDWLNLKGIFYLYQSSDSDDSD